MKNYHISAALGSILLFCASALSALELNWKPLLEPGSGGRIVSLIVSPHEPNRILVGGDMLGVGLSLDRGDSWGETFGFDSWEMADFTWHPKDPNEVWVGSMSGPYKSTDGGRNWISKRRGMGAFDGGMYSSPIQKILFDPNNPQRLIAVGGSHRRWESPGTPKWGVVWESTDGGETWRQIANLRSRNILTAGFAAGSSDSLYAAVDGLGVFVSRDGGRSWQEANTGLPTKNINWIEPHPTEPATAFVALGNYQPAGAATFSPGGIYKTTDFGQTWVPKNKGLSQVKSSDPNQTARYEIVVIAKSNPNVMFTGNTAWTDNTPYISKDGGETWKATAGSVLTAYPAGKSIECAAVDPNDENFILGAGSEYILRTRDGGAKWDDATAYQPPGSKLWRGRGFSGLVCKDFKWHPNDPIHAAFAAMDAGNFWHSTNRLFSWEKAKAPIGNWGGGNELCFAGRHTMFVALGQYNFEGIGRTLDGGKRWQLLMGPAAGLPNQYENKKATSIYALPNDSSRVWAAIGGALYFSEDAGSKWKVIFQQAAVEQVLGAPSNPLHLYLATAKGVYEAKDGVQFVSIKGPQPATRLAVDPQDENVVYAASWRQTGGLWRYRDGVWTRLHSDPYIAAVTVHPTDSNIIAFVTNDHPYHDACFATGVYLSQDGGQTWERQNNGLPMLRGECITFNPHDGNQIVVGLSGRGYYISGFDPSRVQKRDQAGPADFHLLPNFPNPFNSNTTLRFRFERPTKAKIAIYDQTGRVIKSWQEQEFDAGESRWVWDGRDEHGCAASSGVYFVRLCGPACTAAQKIVLLK